MIGAAEKSKLQSALPSNRFHRGERQLQVLQNRPLLDMKLKITQCIVFPIPLEESPPDSVRSSRSPFAPRFLAHREVKKFLVKPAYQRAAADERRAEAYSFFLRKANYLNAERQPSSRSTPRAKRRQARLRECHRKRRRWELCRDASRLTVVELAAAQRDKRHENFPQHQFALEHQAVPSIGQFPGDNRAWAETETSGACCLGPPKKTLALGIER